MNRKTRGKGESRDRPEAIDVVDGVPDRSRRGSPWKYIALLAAFVGWIALLVYIQIAGSLKS